MSLFGREHGSKVGSAGVMSGTVANVQRRDRLRAMAQETADLSQDPYFMKNHLGTFECKLCLTLHTNPGSYLAHTQGKRHQQNLGRRNEQVRQQQEKDGMVFTEKKKIQPRQTIKIGRPGYKVIKQRDPDTGERSLLFQVHYPKIEKGLQPRSRFMSAYEQKVEPADSSFQFLVFAAEPYETIAFKIPATKINTSEGRFFTHWDPRQSNFTLQLFFTNDKPKRPPGEANRDQSAAM